ncbi:hypothetical protein PtA15_6A81 [Puccinia triticina]|uniref:Uncharacterized protein n=1 Tax=Puccinia triticina TaxID=208348 RepID=A0ABY7CM93_9BASI|nr:uncharacterized protein PtA15_6A81 [Puccinia triticina]WAQ85453.1 hypothetical protein PtA15_6A81 [Puccinia triticina]
MVEPQEISVASLIQSFKSLQTSEDDRSLSTQRSLVVQAFKSLIAQCPSICFQPCSSTHEENLPTLFQQVELRTELWNRLKSGLLPSLRHRITALSLSLDPCDLRKDPAGKLKQVLEILSELEQTLVQVKASIATIAPVLKPSAVSDDAHLKHLKAFRCGRVRLTVETLVRVLSELFQSCVRFTENLGDAPGQEAGCRDEVLSVTSMEQWESEVGLVDDALDELTELINRTGPEEANKSGADSSSEDDDDDYFRDSDSPPSEQVLQLARSTLQIIKLARLFLNKLSKTTVRKEACRMVTEMSSSQLESLLSSTRSISRNIDEIVCTLGDADEHDQAFTTDFLIEFGQNLSESFEQIQRALERYLIPLIAEDTPSASSKVTSQTWFAEWNKHFLSATQNYTQNVNSFQRNAS